MSGVDDRIVTMRFDNELFQRKMSDTLTSLDRLRDSLNLAGATRGMQDVQTASNNFNMGGMHGAVEAVSGKFLAMTTIAITALATITSRAVTAGLDIVRALSLEPVLDGFREYETNMNSIQTILANTDAQGTTLQQVNDALDELNHYSDQTIYNFSEMARNIGTFTAAGVDLETSVNAIKGIANLAAISGSNSQQASTAMYQLSQAIAAGRVSLMDWNSVVNAGMGGEVFQRALFTTGQAMGTIVNAPVGMTFDEWTDAGNTFRGSLQDGWLTAEVLTNTLQTFTGDLTEAQIMAMGYTQEQAAELYRLGQVGVAAATEVKTFTQLMGTIKESIASGWSSTFRILVGNFEEAKALFTEINNAIGGMVGRSADARNAMLQTWADFGGRTALIQAFRDVLTGIWSVLEPIKDAFRDIFPPATAETLLVMTERFANFARGLAVGSGTAREIGNAFRGFFAVIEIGWEIFKNVVRLIGDVIGSLSGVGGDLLGFASDTGNTLTRLNDALVEGGGIRDFFDNLRDAIGRGLDKIREFKDIVVEFLSGVPETEAFEGAVGRVNERLSTLQTIVHGLSSAWDWLVERFGIVRDALEIVWGHLSTWFGELRDRIAAVWEPGDFNNVVDAVNVGLLGGLLLAFRRFLNDGLSIDFGGGVMESIRGSLDALTGTLETMQTNLRAQILMRIAIAVGILAASMVALSLIDSGDLARALAAISVGFGQLLTAMSILNNMSIGAGTLRLAGISAGMILMAAAAGILSIAITNLSQLGWEELARGLLGVGGALAAMVLAVNNLPSDTAGMVRTGIAMGAIAVALLILSEAVESFSEMEWESMAQGLVGVGVGLGLLTTAVNFMPPNMAGMGLGMVLLAGGLRLMSEAVEAFAQMSWGEMAQGLVGIGGALLAIAGAMNLMPPGMPATATGIAILGGALWIIANVVEDLGTMDLGTMAQGLGGLAVMLGELALAMTFMTGTAAGAGALVLAAGALFVLSKVLKEIGELELGVLIQGLIGIAGVLAVLGIGAALMTPVIPSLQALSLALLGLGAGFALFGFGASLIATAFEKIARAGSAGVDVLIDILNRLIQTLPEIAAQIVIAMANAAREIVEAAPVFLDAVRELIMHILETIVELVPQVAETFGTIVVASLEFIREMFPEVLETGIELFLTFLRGIRDSIGEIVTVVAEIITNFLDALAEKVPEIIDSVYNLVVAIIEGVVAKLVDVGSYLLPKGREAMQGFMNGISEIAGGILDWFTNLPETILNLIGDLTSWLLQTGVDLLTSLMEGIFQISPDLLLWFTELPGNILEWLGDLTSWLLEKGVDLITGMLRGITETAVAVTTWFTELPGKILEWIGDVATWLLQKGVDFISGMLQGITDRTAQVTEFFTSLPGNILSWIGNVGSTLLQRGIDIIAGFGNGIAERMVPVYDFFRNLPGNIVDWIGDVAGRLLQTGRDILNGLWNGLREVWERIKDWVLDKIGWIESIFGTILRIFSPSKVFMGIGENIMLGLFEGLKDGWKSVDTFMEGAARHTPDYFQEAVGDLDPWRSGGLNLRTLTLMDALIKRAKRNAEDIGHTQPVITPVVDMTEFEEAMRRVGQTTSNIKFSPFDAAVSHWRASEISSTRDLVGSSERPPMFGGSEIKFEQNIYSPTPLSVSDIYRNTRSQFALAKGELGIS